VGNYSCRGEVHTPENTGGLAMWGGCFLGASWGHRNFGRKALALGRAHYGKASAPACSVPLWIQGEGEGDLGALTRGTLEMYLSSEGGRAMAQVPEAVAPGAAYVGIESAAIVLDVDLEAVIREGEGEGDGLSAGVTADVVEELLQTEQHVAMERGRQVEFWRKTHRGLNREASQSALGEGVDLSFEL
jgi:hypothetical protein